MNGSKAFGFSLAIHEDTFVIGDPDGGVERQGEAIIYQRLDGAWSEAARLTAPPELITGGNFGYDVSLYGDLLAISDWNNACAVDCPSLGGDVFIYQRDEQNKWVYVTHLSDKNEDDPFKGGHSISLWREMLLVGAEFKNSAELYGRHTGGPDAWNVMRKLNPPSETQTSEKFGFSVAQHDDLSVIGSPVMAEARPGRVVVYTEEDYDEDGVPNTEDVSPTDPNSDSDFDGISDINETAQGSDPLDPLSPNKLPPPDMDTSQSDMSASSDLGLKDDLGQRGDGRAAPAQLDDFGCQQAPSSPPSPLNLVLGALLGVLGLRRGRARCVFLFERD